MTAYEYTARDNMGHVFSGVYNDISSTAALRSELGKIGYLLLKAKRVKLISTPGSIKVKRQDVVTFAYKLAGMCTAGLSIVQCLETLEKQTESPSLKFVISDVKKSIETGSSLTDSFNKYRSIFSDFFIGMIEAGESSGKLAESLEISARYLEKQADLRNRLKSAFMYPMIVLVMCFVIVTALVLFVVPVFSKIYHQLGVPLPGPTQTLIMFSVILRKFWPILIIVAASLSVCIKYLSKNPFIKTKWDYFKFSMPLLGKLNKMVAVSNFIRSFALLIITGVPIIKALQVAGLVGNNEKVVDISKDIQKSIQSGIGFAEALESHNIFPPIIIQLADSGEQAGQLGQMLTKGVDFLEKDIDRTVSSLLVKLEPALTLGMGVVIGLILMAVYLPMFDYMAQLK